MLTKRDISNVLAQFSELKIRLIAIGGTSLILRGIKTIITVDLDFVAEKRSQLQEFRRLLGYTRIKNESLQ